MSTLEASNIGAYLEAQATKETLRFITCGSVDDGKSSLIGRLLHESKSIFDDQLEALARDSVRYGTQGEKLDLALLVDGLQAEREQGITIDVAYRFFATEKRRYIVADTPGHEQYTRNMATGASTADVAVLLVDARKGLSPQTHRHARICALMGIAHVIVAVNKMDLVAYDEAVYAKIVAEFAALAVSCGIRSFAAVPLSALTGENVIAGRERMPWYTGATLMGQLEAVDLASLRSGGGAPGAEEPFRMAVQHVIRPDLDFRGFAGRVARGSVRPGDAVKVLPSGSSATVARIVTFDGDLAQAERGDSVTLTLDREVDASRGDMLVAPGDEPTCTTGLEAHLVWLGEEPAVPGRAYLLAMNGVETSATIREVHHLVDVTTGEARPATSLAMNAIAVVTIVTSKPVVCEPYRTSRKLGGFILIDKLSFATVGAGLVERPHARPANIRWHTLDVDKASRARQKGQAARCIWFTGLSGSGKSTIANLLERRLHGEGRHTYVLDGDNVRHGLNRDLGFSEADRVENLRRVGEVAKLMVDAGLLVLVSFISPFRSERAKARSLFGPGEFVEVFVDTPIVECERRDPKGLYAKARSGALRDFTGIDSPYEAPLEPEIRLRPAEMSPEACVEAVVSALAVFEAASAAP
jgi:bifunctional enzyme CysN/CysC